MYTVEHYITHSKEFTGKQGRRQIFDLSILPYKFGLIFKKNKAKKKKNLKKKTQNGRFFKIAIFQNRQFSKLFVKISWIGPWVSRID